ncbi:TlpA disulfide reductase family protein [uncultured Algibacter sp.]|uniref:TlpA family protein disulfide reductase n=1 Tax=uncultured Algibacter sp. TaxID=298659 RepID=UPI0026189EC7|nr:TlpA disulfide reductase family protein [uncultured Algibacter sp.]
MKFNKSILYLFCFLSSSFIFGQIRVSEYIQPSVISKTSDNQLYFIDFWATWCGPCIHASKYVESLQKQYPENFYVLSLSQESPDVVKRFMLKHKNGLATAIDYEGETFSKNKVMSLPYSILYNAQGVKLWEGHPADFKSYHVDQYLRDNRSTIAKHKMIVTQAYQKVETIQNLEVPPKKDFLVEKLNKNWDNSLQITQKDTYLELKGRLQDILAYALDSHKSQINMSSELDEAYRVRIKNNTKASYEKSKYILKALKLKKANQDKRGEVIVFDVNAPRFWDTNQIDWGQDTQHFLIGDAEIKADNVTLSQVKYQLSNVLETPIILVQNNVDSAIHDWDIHYKYYDLMVSAMKDSYGIDISKKVVEYPEYVITKRGR